MFHRVITRGINRAKPVAGRSALYRGSVLLSAFLLVIGTGGCGAAAKTVAKAPPVAVATETVEPTSLPTAESFLGTITPYIQTVLSPALSGILNSVNVRTGDVVRQGQALASIDTSLLQAQEGQANANIGVAQAQLGATSEGTAKSLAQAAAALQTAQTNLDNAKTSAGSAVAERQQGLAAARQGVTAAEKALATSQTQLANVRVQYGNSVKQEQAALNQAQASLDAANVQAQSATNSLSGAQAAYNTASTALQRAEQMAHSPNDPNLLAAQTVVDQATINLQNAQSNVANSTAGVTKAKSAVAAAQAALQAAQANKTVQTAEAQVAQAQAGVQAAEIQVAQAQATLESTQTTGNNGVAAAEATLKQQQTAYQTLLGNPQLQVNAAQVQAAQAGVQVIQAQINDGKVMAPVSGYVTAVNAQVGQAVGPQGGFITIASMSPLQATVDIPENLIGKMKPGLTMSVFVPAVDETLTGSVSKVHPAPDPTNKEYGVDITLQPGQQQLLPGMQVEAHLTNSGQKGIVVPADSLVTMQSGALSVFLVVNGKAKQQMVRVGAMTGSVYQITSGLKPGDVVIVKGQNLVSDGNPVQIENSPPATAGAKGTKSPSDKAGGGKSTSQ